VTTAVELGVFVVVQSWARFGRLFANASIVYLVTRGESDVCSAMPIYVDVSLVADITTLAASCCTTREDVIALRGKR
jgi:hypothetical protein